MSQSPRSVWSPARAPWPPGRAGWRGRRPAARSLPEEARFPDHPDRPTRSAAVARSHRGPVALGDRRRKRRRTELRAGRSAAGRRGWRAATSVASGSIGRLRSIPSLPSCTWSIAEVSEPGSSARGLPTPPRAAFRRWYAPSIITRGPDCRNQPSGQCGRPPGAGIRRSIGSASGRHDPVGAHLPVARELEEERPQVQFLLERRGVQVLAGRDPRYGPAGGFLVAARPAASAYS